MSVFQLLATTGMRRGELFGLRWGEVDWDRGALSVVRSLGLVDGDLVMSPGKTATSRRLVFLDAATFDDLRGHFCATSLMDWTESDALCDARDRLEAIQNSQNVSAKTAADTS